MLTKSEYALFETLIENINARREFEDELVTCALCLDTFKRGGVFKVHLRKGHLSDVIYICDACEESVRCSREDNVRGDYSGMRKK